jgi:hypothetical protein
MTRKAAGLVAGTLGLVAVGLVVLLGQAGKSAQRDFAIRPGTKAVRHDAGFISPALLTAFPVLSRREVDDESAEPAAVVSELTKGPPFMDGASQSGVTVETTTNGVSVWAVPGPAGMCLAYDPPVGPGGATRSVGVCQGAKVAASEGLAVSDESPGGATTIVGMLPVGDTVTFQTARSANARSRVIHPAVENQVFSVTLRSGGKEFLRSVRGGLIRRFTIA